MQSINTKHCLFHIYKEKRVLMSTPWCQSIHGTHLTTKFEPPPPSCQRWNKLTYCVFSVAGEDLQNFGLFPYSSPGRWRWPKLEGKRTWATAVSRIPSEPHFRTEPPFFAREARPNSEERETCTNPLLIAMAHVLPFLKESKCIQFRERGSFFGCSPPVQSGIRNHLQFSSLTRRALNGIDALPQKIWRNKDPPPQKKQPVFLLAPFFSSFLDILVFFFCGWPTRSAECRETLDRCTLRPIFLSKGRSWRSPGALCEISPKVNL